MDDVMAKCPHCGQIKPMYVGYANIPPETNPLKELGINWVKVIWHIVPDRPIELVYTRGCPRDAGQLEVAYCHNCGKPLGDQTPPEMAAILQKLVGRIRVQNDAEMIELMQDLLKNPGDSAPVPNQTVQMPNGLTITTDNLYGYLRTAQDAKLRENWLNGGAYEEPQKVIERDDWPSLLKFIRQAESLDTLKWPKPDQEHGGDENLGVVVSEILPNGKLRNIAPISVLRDPGITQEIRWTICASAYLWKLSNPKDKLLIRQVDILFDAL